MPKHKIIPISNGITTYEMPADVLKDVIRDAVLEALLAKEFMDAQMEQTFRRREETSDSPVFDYASGVAKGIELARSVLESAAGQD